jgi:hypothetical protein
VNVLVVQQQEVYGGSWAARATSTGAGASAYRSLTPQPELYARVRFKLVSKGANSVGLMRFRTATGTAMGSLSLSSTGKLTFRNDTAGVSTTSTTAVAAGAWHELQLHMLVNGASGQVDVWLDGTHVDALSKIDSFGTAPIGRLEIGDTSSGRTFDVAFDDVLADTVVINRP